MSDSADVNVRNARVLATLFLDNSVVHAVLLIPVAAVKGVEYSSQYRMLVVADDAAVTSFIRECRTMTTAPFWRSACRELLKGNQTDVSPLVGRNIDILVVASGWAADPAHTKLWCEHSDGVRPLDPLFSRKDWHDAVAKYLVFCPIRKRFV